MALHVPRIEVYRSGSGYRWRRKARNGRITHSASETLENKTRMVKQLRKEFPEAEVVEVPSK